MDQATNTAGLGLTETEKYISNENEASSESDTEEVQDILLGGIRTGLRTITRTTREVLSTCKNKTGHIDTQFNVMSGNNEQVTSTSTARYAKLDEEAQRIKESSLKLLKIEKKFLKSANIISEVIEDLASDYEDEEESLSKDRAGSGDASAHLRPTPHIFRVSEENLESIRNFKEKLTKEFNKRMDVYEDSLTDSVLEQDNKFTALLDQIKLGKKDAKSSMKKSSGETEAIKKVKKKVKPAKDINHAKESSNSSFISNLPYTSDDLLYYQYKPYDEDNDMDHSVLPAIDPITKNPISFPVKNKYCNHVFDMKSISSFITSNPASGCPVHMCRNRKKLEMDHFVSDSILTSHVRRKNNLE